MFEEFKKIIRNKIVLAVMSILLGVILVVHQKAAIDSLVRILGIILLVGAAVFLAVFLAKKEKQASPLIFAIISFIVGMLFTIKPGMIVNIFPAIMGVILIISGLADLAHSITAPEGTNGKVFLILFSMLVILLGVLALFNPKFIANAIAFFIGLFLLFNGVFDLILMIVVKEKPVEKKEG